MAVRRMIAITILDCDNFLEMPLSTQSLYVHLEIRADDDGFVNNPKYICRMVGANPDELKLLADKGYIIPFDSGVIVITHWKVHNYIRSDRYTPTIYKYEKSLLSVDENKIYRLGIPNDNHLDTQVSIGKGSSGKDRSEVVSAARKFFGEYRHVVLDAEQYDKLIKDYGRELTDSYIRKVDEYCQKNNKKYKDYNLTIRTWIRKDGADVERNSRNSTEHTADSDEFNESSYSTDI